MQLLSVPFGTEGNQVEDSTLSVASPLITLGADPNIQPVYAIIAKPYDIGGASETTVYLAGEKFTTSASDTPASTTFSEGVSSPYQIQNQLFAGGQISGQSTLQPGQIEIENYDRGFDSFATYSWRGREITIYVGLESFISAGKNSDSVPSEDTTFKNFAKVFTGTADSISWQENFINIRLRDNRYKLQIPIQSNFYLGEESANGTDISFTASTDVIASSTTDFSDLSSHEYIEVSGSSSNDGLYKVSSVTANSITVDNSVAGLSDESAGASVTITGRLEGRDDLKGKPKPLIYGQVRQVKPDLVDASNLIYRIHDGSNKSVGMVRDQGSDLSGGTTDHANGVGLWNATVTAGGYDTCLAEGLIRLESSPAGTVTYDAEGANGGSLGYQSSVAQLVRKIITEQVSGFSDSDLELASFNSLDTDNSSVVGYATGLSEIDTLNVIDELVSSIGAFFTFTRVGKILVGRIDDPSGETAEVTFDEEDMWPERDSGKFLRSPANRPSYRVRVGYKRYWEVLSENDVALGVTDANRADFVAQFRYASDTDSTVQTTHLDANLLTTNSLLDTEANASTEATRLLGLYDQERDLYEIRLRNGLFQYDLGAIVEFNTTASIYGLESGKKFVVVGFFEDAGSANREEDISLFLWG